MAYYSSRVDDDGNEILRRLTARSSTSSSSASRMLTACSRSSDDGFSKIRIINRAAFIETDFSDTSSLDEKGSIPKSEDQSTSNIVPLLDLQSEDGQNSNRAFNFSYRKHYDHARVDPNDAYKTWLSAKRKMQSDEKARLKKIEEEKMQAEKERKEKANEEYQKWLKKKELSKAIVDTKPLPPNRPIYKKNPDISLESEQSFAMAKLAREEAQLKILEWEKKKRLENEEKRLKKQLEEERKRKIEDQRRKLADEAWHKWQSTAASKPKPVPLNQGFFTLKGTVSDIYINPNEWQS